jgi:hypothetical protein
MRPLWWRLGMKPLWWHLHPARLRRIYRRAGLLALTAISAGAISLWVTHLSAWPSLLTFLETMAPWTELPGVVRLRPSGASGECNIKGNISLNGERIFHVPGQEYYSVTVVDPHQGERWFCSQWEAWRAGWRKARR